MPRNFGVTPHTDVEELSIANGAALSAAFDASRYINGIVIIPDGWTAANLGFKISDTLAGTYVVAKDKEGVPFQISTINTTTGAAYAIPIELFPAPFVKLWSKNTTAATETDANQTGAKALKVLLK